jgi:hypothetical protein
MTEDIHSLLAAAAADVEAAGVPDDLRAAAFAAAIQLRTVGTTPAQTPRSRGESQRTADPGDWRAAIATALTVDPEVVDEAFTLVDGRMHLTIPPSRLPSGKAAAMKDVALLVCSARQVAGLDEDGYTDSAIVRDECRELGVLDPNNFAAEVARLDDLMSFRGSGRSRHFRVNRRGLERAGERLRELLRRD